jgi:hypothetical protein
MTDVSADMTVTMLPGPDLSDYLTPAGLQPRRLLAARRALVLALNLATMLLLGYGLSQVLGAGGWSIPDIVIFVCFLVGVPWTAMGFWNALIGLWVLHGSRLFGGRGLHEACPIIDDGLGDETVSARVAVLMFLRNEDPGRALGRLAAVRESLDATGQGHAFDVFVLSDTNDPAIADEEEATFARLRGRLGPNAIYRRRTRNEGYKSGNARDFLRRWGNAYTFFVPLDSDSLMSGDAILRLVRTMQKPVCADLPVRHAPRDAELHRRCGMVAWRCLRLLGPQCRDPHGALQGPLPPAGAARWKAARRSHTQPRSDRGGADAARRVRVPHPARRDRQLRGQPPYAVRFHEARPPLV